MEGASPVAGAMALSGVTELLHEDVEMKEKKKFQNMWENIFWEIIWLEPDNPDNLTQWGVAVCPWEEASFP